MISGCSTKQTQLYSARLSNKPIQPMDQHKQNKQKQKKVKQKKN